MTDEQLRGRSAEEVFEAPLRLAGEHRFEEHIERYVAAHCVILERRGLFRGREGVESVDRS